MRNLVYSQVGVKEEGSEEKQLVSLRESTRQQKQKGKALRIPKQLDRHPRVTVIVLSLIVLSWHLSIQNANSSAISDAPIGHF